MRFEGVSDDVVAAVAGVGRLRDEGSTWGSEGDLIIERTKMIMWKLLLIITQKRSFHDARREGMKTKI